MRGYSFLSGVNNNVAPFARCRLIFDFITIGPVNHKPAGISTTPPPFLFIAAIAPLIAFVFRKFPSAIAPNFFMLIVSFLNFGVETTKRGEFWAKLKIEKLMNRYVKEIFIMDKL